MSSTSPCTTTTRKTNQTGLYVQDQIALDNWRLTLGGREDWIHTGTEFHNQNNVTNTQRDKKFSGNAALSYVFDNGVTPYISFAQSFQAAAGSTVNSTEAFKPTEGEQYEAGIKYQPPGTKTLLTAAVFDLTQKKTTPSPKNNVTRQVGEVQVRGLELEASGDVTDNLKLIGSYTYNDSEITKGTAAEKKVSAWPRCRATRPPPGRTTPGITARWMALASAPVCVMSATPTATPPTPTGDMSGPTPCTTPRPITTWAV
nr:hypothetical protein GCM10020185_40500 [Pseudomonas brassicacearum subsp. brassicacearum]